MCMVLSVRHCAHYIVLYIGMASVHMCKYSQCMVDIIYRYLWRIEHMLTSRPRKDIMS